MKTAISLPKDVYFQAERYQKKMKLGRSELYSLALSWYVKSKSNLGITEQLNKVYNSLNDNDNILESSAIHDLPRNDWK